VLATALPALIGVSDVVVIADAAEPTYLVHTAFRTTPTTFGVVIPIVNFLCVVGAALYAARYRDLLDELEAENRARVHALSRLV
jgi:hypothetical protein